LEEVEEVEICGAKYQKGGSYTHTHKKKKLHNLPSNPFVHIEGETPLQHTVLGNH
jgi:hypothetical protein